MTNLARTLQFLQGGGELGALIRAADWSLTALGPIDTWPQSLKTTLGILLNSRYPMFVFWGPELIKIYNDGYAPILGNKHPWALGRPAREVWPEIWSDIEPLVDRALSGDPTWSDDLLLFMERNGFPEEVYFTFSYSPVPDESGGIGGMFCACTETTGEVLSERRLQTLRDLAAGLAASQTERDACVESARLLHANRADAPFTAIYLLDENGAAELAAQAGSVPGHAVSPLFIERGDDRVSWPVHEVMLSRTSQVVSSLRTRFAVIPAGPWGEAPDSAMVLPLLDRSLDRAIGAIVLGISSRRPFDADYRGWFELVAGQISASITGARALEQERRRAEALADLDRAKTTFFSNVSHEFRTPLTLMLGPTGDALRSGTPLEGDTLKMVHRNQLRLLKLVNSLLDFSRLEAGRAEALREPTDLAALTTDLAAVFRTAVENAGLRLVVDCAPLPEPVLVDRAMWEKIVFNLLSNAFKFTLDGAITVRLRDTGASVTLEVTDTGTGIPAHELPRVFEKFHRVAGARGRTFEGSGIGLALVRELATLHGGSVSVQSEVGRGSTFTVTVPHAALPQHAAAPATALAPSSTTAEAHLEEMLRSLPAASAGPPPAGGARPRIVVADDNADMRSYITGLLSPTCDVIAVADGDAALAAVHAQPVALVLTDVMMPRLSGIELLQCLRDDERTRAVPVILVSARAGEDDTIAGLDTGADDYIVKPFTARELVARVHGRLELAAERRRREAAVRENEARSRHTAEQLQLVTDALPALVSYVDRDRRYQFNNRAYTEWFGDAPDTLRGRSLEEVLGAAAYEQVRPHVEAALAGRRVSFDAVLEYRSGGPRDVHVDYVPDLDDTGATRGFYALITDHSERHRAEKALRDADRRKDEFLAMLAHELRNPLAPIRSAAEVLRMGETPAAPQRWAREVIERQTQHLTRLVDDLLDVSRITRGMVTIRREPLDLGMIVQRSIETSRPMIDARRQQLSVRLPETPLRVQGDHTRLVQILANLLNNAAKYTEEGGHIWVEVRDEGAFGAISVRDNGIGLSSDLLPQVFDLFTQATRSLDRSQGGLGVGLTLVRRLVDLHGGTVQALSAGAGHGSEFIVRLPLIMLDAAGESPDDPVPHPASAGDRRLRVLVVEDHVDSADMMVYLIRAAGHRVHKAADGASALEAALATPPDVVVCDIGLPGMNGYELAAQIRQQPALRGVRLIAITGYGRDEDRRRAEQAGFDAHLTKPVEPAALHALLQLGVHRS
ncbi:MAG TPA: ATP-binding protein [Vicinamibacterales bacterium]|nr:ATP-binding protein [Vicinamibacterales bacterium]